MGVGAGRGAQLAAPLLDARDGMRVLDACAAPGGKSTHLLELANVELTALDNDIVRVARITKNFSRLELDAYRSSTGMQRTRRNGGTANNSIVFWPSTLLRLWRGMPPSRYQMAEA